MAKNPFTNIVASRQADADNQAEAATSATASASLRQVAEARAEQQAQSALRDGDDSHATRTPDNTPAPSHSPADTPAASSDSESPIHAFSTNLNGELGAVEAAANADLQRLIEKGGASDEDPTGGSQPTESPADRLHAGGAGFDPRQRASDATSDPEDHGKGADAVAALQGDLRSEVSGNSGPDAMTTALEGLLTDAASHDTSPLNVGADGPLANAVNSVTPADLAAEAAKNNVTPPSSPPPSSTPASTPPATGSQPASGSATPAPSGSSSGDHARDPGFISTLVADGPVAAIKELVSAPVTAAAAQEAKAADQASGGSGRGQPATTTVAAAQQQLGIHNLESGFVPTGGSTAGGGAKLTDPNQDPDQGGKPTAARLAFVHALNEATHTGPAFHNPGNVDPGPEGDQSGLATGAVSAGTLASHTGVTRENTRLGDPGNPNTGEEAGGGGHLSGSIGPGHSGGTPGDAQGGIIQDDGNSPRGTEHETGPGNEHFGPSDSLGATPPASSSDDSSSNSTNSSDDSLHLTLNPALVAEFEEHHAQELFPHHDDD